MSDDATSGIQPVIITLAPVDYTKTRAFASAKALADEICECHAAGAAVVHFHVTDIDGHATGDTAFFNEVVGRIQDACDIVIEGSTGGAGVPWNVRAAALKARGLKMASLNMGSCNLFGHVYANTPEEISNLASRMDELGITPDMCFFEPGFFTSVTMLEKKRLLKGSPVASICLGFPGALPATMENLVFMISKLPPRAEWTLVHHGARDFALLGAAIAAGGNIRVGFEDSRELGGGVSVKRNAELVFRARALVEQLGRKVASPSETRRRYGIHLRGPATAK